MSKIRLKLMDVPDGGAKTVRVDDRLQLAVFRVGEKVAAIDNRCPHAGAPLGEGVFDGTQVKCPLHGFRVDVWRGVGNGGKPVPSFPVSVANGEICILLSEEGVARK